MKEYKCSPAAKHKCLDHTVCNGIYMGCGKCAELNRKVSSGTEIEQLRQENAAKDKQIATLEKALKLACADAADEQCPHEFGFYTCARCYQCPHGCESHTDAARDAKCWQDYYIHCAQQKPTP